MAERSGAIPYIKVPDTEGGHILELLERLCDVMSHRRQRLRNAIVLLKIDRLIRERAERYGGQPGAVIPSRDLREDMSSVVGSHTTILDAIAELSADGFIRSVPYEPAKTPNKPHFMSLNWKTLEDAGVEIGWLDSGPL